MAKGTVKRKRLNVDITIDPNSDEEREVELGVVGSIGGAKLMRDVHVKRTKTATTSANVAKEVLSSPVPPLEKKRRKQGASIMMGIFSQHFDALQSAILGREYDAAVTSDCSCGSGPAHYRCEECFCPEPSCKKCIIDSHQHFPLHHVQEWTGTYFTRRSLSELGMIIRLGHYTRRCPNAPHGSTGRPMVIVSTNGIHDAKVLYCHCATAVDEPLQLVSAGLFPATIDQPETAFTLTLLDDFDVHSLTSKKSAYDHFIALRKHTNGAFPHLSHDRYREFLRVVRVWSHLTCVRRQGQARVHNIDLILTHRRPNSLAVYCPACPEIGFNVFREFLASLSPAERHKVTKYLCGDGNYRLVHEMNGKFDPDDVALADGNAYFSDKELFEAYLKTVGDSDERSTCNRLKAALMQNLAKFKNNDVSGVFAIICARHGFFEPQGMVDLQKGERYANSDYALAQVLRSQKDQPYIVYSYDIECQHSIHRVARFEKAFPDLVEVVKRVVGCIPQMHIRNHKDDCQYRFSFAYTEGVGCTCGEIIETTWAEGNQTSGSTKKQNSGHRHDSLDRFHGYWNWEKLIKLAHQLYRQYIKTRGQLLKFQVQFDALTATHDKKLIDKWAALDTTPRQDNGEWYSVHRSNWKKGPRTQGQRYQTLCQKETDAELFGKIKSGTAAFINKGLGIEADMERLRKLVSLSEYERSRGDEATISKARSKLRRDIIQWRAYQVNHYPKICDHIPITDSTRPEEDHLQLPSAFTSAQRNDLDLGDVAVIEYDLREGQAHDALHAVREAIKTFNYNIAFKKTNIRGQRANTRAQKFLQSLAKDKVSAADKYRRARVALVKLGLSEDDKVLQPLHDSELWMKNVNEPRKLGETSTPDPWFWTVGRPNGMSMAEEADWSQEMDRVKWFRERANRDRYREEVEILEADFERTIFSHSRMAEVWTGMAEHCLDEPGAAAYARKKAVMYRNLSDEASQKYTDAKADADKAGRYTSQHI